jgi:uncharacterized protein with beta-barrel porin domain
VNALEQTGVSANYINGNAQYSAWWEMIPAPSVPITTMAISPGDRMYAGVQYIGAGNFVLSLNDLTTGQTFSTTQPNAAAPRTSVEWIAEATSLLQNGQPVIQPLANYGTVNFTGAAASVNGSAPVPISSLSGYTAIVLSPNSGWGGTALGLTNNGQNFTVTVTPPAATTLFWSPNGATSGNDASGNWDATTADWANGTGSTAWADGQVAEFGAGTVSPATVILQAPISVADLVFNAGGPPTGNYYTLASATPGDALTVTDGAILANSNDEISAPIDFTDGLVLSGTGTLTLSGDNTNTIGTIINPGASLLVNGSGAFGAGDVTNFGTLGITGPQYAVNIPGDFSQGQTGALIVRVGGAQAGRFDHYIVNGNATLSGDLDVSFQGSYAPSGPASLTVLSAGSITGTFSSITLSAHPIDLSASTSYTPSSANLLFTIQMPALAPYAVTPNQLAVAQYLDTTDGYNGQSHPSTSYQQLISGIGSAYSSQIPGILDQLSPIDLQAFPQVAIQNGINLDQTFSQYAQTIDTGARGLNTSGLTLLQPGEDSPNQAALGQMLQSQADVVSLDNNIPAELPGYLSNLEAQARNLSHPAPTTNWGAFVTGAAQFDDYSNTGSISSPNITTADVTAGIDYHIAQPLAVGVLFNYAHSFLTLDPYNSKGSVNSYTPGVYANLTKNGWFVDGLAAYTYSSNSETRNITAGPFSGAANGNFSGNAINGSIDLGKQIYSSGVNFSGTGGWTLVPMVSLGYTHADFSSFSETGAGAANLNVQSFSTDSFRTVLSTTFLYRIVASPNMAWTPGLTLGWRHEYLNDSQGITSQLQGAGTGGFTINTESPSRDVAIIAPSLSVTINRNISAFVDYELDVGSSNFHAQQVFAGVAVAF